MQSKQKKLIKMIGSLTGVFVLGGIFLNASLVKDNEYSTIHHEHHQEVSKGGSLDLSKLDFSKLPLANDSTEPPIIASELAGQNSSFGKLSTGTSCINLNSLTLPPGNAPIHLNGNNCFELSGDLDLGDRYIVVKDNAELKCNNYTFLGSNGTRWFSIYDSAKVSHCIFEMMVNFNHNTESKHNEFKYTVLFHNSSSSSFDKKSGVGGSVYFNGSSVGRDFHFVDGHEFYVGSLVERVRVDNIGLYGLIIWSGVVKELDMNLAPTSTRSIQIYSGGMLEKSSIQNSRVDLLGNAIIKNSRFISTSNHARQIYIHPRFSGRTQIRNVTTNNMEVYVHSNAKAFISNLTIRNAGLTLKNDSKVVLDDRFSAPLKVIRAPSTGVYIEPLAQMAVGLWGQTPYNYDGSIKVMIDKGQGASDLVAVSEFVQDPSTNNLHIVNAALNGTIYVDDPSRVTYASGNNALGGQNNPHILPVADQNTRRPDLTPDLGVIQGGPLAP